MWAELIIVLKCENAAQIYSAESVQLGFINLCLYVLHISNPSIVVNSACSATTVMMKTLFLEMTRNEFVVQL